MTEAATRGDGVDVERLKEHVRRLSVLRHGVENYEELERVAEYIEEVLVSCGLEVGNQYFEFKRRKYRNIMATIEGLNPELPPLLLGAHYDGNRGTPGADDNASGVAVLLETARLLSRERPVRPLELVAFTLEEPQTFTHIIRRGSRFFAREARRGGVPYEGAVILECVGYVTREQTGAALARLTGLNVPSRGDFLAVVANKASKPLMDAFIAVADRVAPDLKTTGYAAPLQGYLLPQARFSDQSSFWERGYPAIMLNDTVMFRNPNYHRASDLPETLNYRFMKDVTRAVAEFLKGYR